MCLSAANNVRSPAELARCAVLEPTFKVSRCSLEHTATAPDE